MIVQEFTLGKIGWRVKVFYAVTGYYLHEILNELRRVGCRGDELDKAYRQMYNFELDSGITYSDPVERESVMVIALTSNSKEFANSLQHEQRHLERHICQALGIDPYSEDASYLAGEINASMFSHAKHFLCEHCRGNLPGKKRDSKTGLFYGAVRNRHKPEQTKRRRFTNII